MADSKISGLPASTVPLAGTEVLPIVQGGATKQVSIANVTAGRAIAATSITTDTYKAASSSGGALQNSSGTPQLQWGAGGGNNLSVDVAININPANAAVAISPTGTGTLTINPATASTMNNVAIGGTTPLAGAFTTATANSFIPNSATIPTNGVYLPATNAVGLATNSTERMRITSAGDVGIGTSNPLVKFQVKASTDYNGGFFETGGAFTFTAFNDAGTASIPLSINGSDLRLRTGGVDRMRIFASGGVSLGNTTDPGATNLSVTGTVTGSVFSSASGTTASTASGTPVTFTTVPSVPTGVWLVTGSVVTSASSWVGVYLLKTEEASATLAPLSAATSALTITMSGLSIQGTQTSGAALPIFWSITRIV